MLFAAALDKKLKTIEGVGGRVYPQTAQEANAKNGIPYIVHIIGQGVKNKTLGGFQNSYVIDVEINVIGKTDSEMKRMSAKVIDLVLDVERTYIDDNAPFIKEITYEQPREFYEQQAELYRCLIDFRFYT